MNRRAVVASLGAGMLAGCISLQQPAPPIREYRLDYAAPVMSVERLPVIVRVAPLTVTAVYDRQQIVYRDDRFTTGTYFYHRWSTNPGQMLTDLLARDLADGQSFAAVQQGVTVAPGDYQLSGAIEEIEERPAENGCAAHLAVRLILVRARRPSAGRVLWQTPYVADEPCACNDVAALARAMSAAAERVSSQVQRAVYEAIRNDRP
jgi:ABC-type uncharacterized transport system auxiliary subunit